MKCMGCARVIDHDVPAPPFKGPSEWGMCWPCEAKREYNRGFNEAWNDVRKRLGLEDDE